MSVALPVLELALLVVGVLALLSLATVPRGSR